MIILNNVVLIGTKTSTYIGKPVVPDAAVHAVVEEQILDKKVIVFKYKKKRNYCRNIGHRQPITRIRIMGITGYEDSPAVTLQWRVFLQLLIYGLDGMIGFLISSVPIHSNQFEDV